MSKGKKPPEPPQTNHDKGRRRIERGDYAEDGMPPLVVDKNRPAPVRPRPKPQH